jgi:hypothetical protein
MACIIDGKIHGVTLSPATKGLITKAGGLATVVERYQAVRRALERQIPREQAKHTAREMFYFQFDYVTKARKQRRVLGLTY